MKAEFKYYDDCGYGHEYAVYSYRGVIISFDFYEEGEWLVDDIWYSTCEEAEDYIDKILAFEALSNVEKEKVLALQKEYHNLRYCSFLNDICPYGEDCDNCSLMKSAKIAKEDVKKLKDKYEDVFKYKKRK